MMKYLYLVGAWGLGWALGNMVGTGHITLLNLHLAVVGGSFLLYYDWNVRFDK